MMMTGYASLDGAVDAMAIGAADYLIKPLKPKEIVARINALFERRRLEAQLQHLEGELRSRYDIHSIVAESPRMNALSVALRRIAPSDAPVILFGERGSGRSFLGRAMHYSGSRRDKPFAWLSCDQGGHGGAIEEIFGRSTPKGIQRGHLERLRTGTLQLREPQTLPHKDQEQLAACVAEQCFRRIGSDEPLPLEARLILSFSAPVSELLDRGDLHPSMDVLKKHVAIRVPPLRERAEDLPGLVSIFLNKLTEGRSSALRISSSAFDLLMQAEWPGNVAQLFATLKQAAILSQGRELTEENVSLSLRQSNLEVSPWAPMADHLGDREKQLVLQAVNQHRGRLDQAAKDLGISRTTLWRRMRKYGIQISAS
jgi:two-component system response regulator HydG